MIDADPIVWAVGCVVKDDPLENALHTVKLKLNYIVEQTGADEHQLYLTGGNNFRYDIDINYKANRVQAKPHWFHEIREYMSSIWGAEIVDGIEADDAIGLASDPKTSIICSIDKDLDQLPGKHYNYNQDRLYNVTYEEGMHFFYKQMLMGDRADNIEGIKGIGKVKAEKMLSDLSLDKKMCKVGLEYACHFDDPEDVYMKNSKLLWILR